MIFHLGKITDEIGPGNPPPIDAYNILPSVYVSQNNNDENQNRDFDIWQLVQDYWYIPAIAVMVYFLFKR